MTSTDSGHGARETKNSNDKKNESTRSDSCVGEVVDKFNNSIRFKKITIHCSDTENFKSVSVDTIRIWHKKRGFADIGYHYVIDVDGAIYSGRPLSKDGAHVKNANKMNLGICLIGRDQFTNNQIKSLRGLCVALMSRFGIDKDYIYCHYEFESAKELGKTCPNIKKEELLQRLGFS